MYLTAGSEKGNRFISQNVCLTHDTTKPREIREGDRFVCDEGEGDVGCRQVPDADDICAFLYDQNARLPFTG